MERQRLTRASTHAVLVFLVLWFGLSIVATLCRGVLAAAGIIAPHRHHDARAVLAAVASLLALLIAVAAFWWEYHRDPPER